MPAKNQAARNFPTTAWVVVIGKVISWGEDVFIHVEVVRQSGLADLSPGEAIVLRTVDGKRGRMAAQVLAWESATRQG